MSIAECIALKPQSLPLQRASSNSKVSCPLYLMAGWAFNEGRAFTFSEYSVDEKKTAKAMLLRSKLNEMKQLSLGIRLDDRVVPIATAIDYL